MKKYFNNSMYFLSVAFVCYFLYDIYELFFAKTVNGDLFEVWNLVKGLKSLLAIIAIVSFIQFMNKANSKQLFSNISSKLWYGKSIILLFIGILSFIETRFHQDESVYFATAVFLSSFCFAMSKVFKEGTALQKENDLTI